MFDYQTSMLRILILLLYLRLFSATVPSEITSYARVSKNGQLARSSHDSFSWITRFLTRNSTNTSENRSINDIAITLSPVYVSPKIPKLRKGEAIDHPVAPRYSTLDHDMIAKLDAGRKQIQQRFHPPAIFEHDVAHTNGRPQKGASASVSATSSDVNSSSFPGPIFSGMYEYSSPDFLDDKPASKPIISVGKYPPIDTDDKMPDSYKPSPNNYHADDDHETDYPSFDVPPSYENDAPVPKPVKYATGHHDHPYQIVKDPYDHHVFHHDVIYDHIPEYHEHHHEHTTEEPEMNDQRLDKRPYSYYFIGKKLWYIPLYFSIYFIIYIAALVLKSIARHKINFPAHLAEAAVGHSQRSDQNDGWWHLAGKILEGIERFAETSGKSP